MEILLGIVVFTGTLRFYVIVMKLKTVSRAGWVAIHARYILAKLLLGVIVMEDRNQILGVYGFCRA